jgi:Ni/Co efflux regulator RcnB
MRLRAAAALLIALTFAPAGLAAELPAKAPAAAGEELAKRKKKKKKKKRKKQRKKKKKKKKKKGNKRASGPVEIPIDVGMGPIGLLPSPPLLLEQPAFTGFTLSIAAIVDRATIKKYKDRIPKQYRRAAGSVSRVEVTPWWLKLIPETFIISPDISGLVPGVTNTGMYGAIWRPIGLGLTLVDEPVRLSANASLSFIYAYVHSQTRADTHFLRPGLTLDGTLEIPLGEQLLVSTGWASDLFIPQPLGGAPWEILPWQSWLWHLGGPFFKVHIRFPYEVNL